MNTKMLVYVGTYTENILFGTGKILEGKGEGIHIYGLDASTGALMPVDTVKGVVNPSYLTFHPTRRFLYSVNELKMYEGRPSGAVSAFAVDPATGSLTFLNRRPTHGTDPCHVVVDGTGKHVFVANFMSGSLCVLPVMEDGCLGPASDFIQHQGSSIDPNRQKGPHAHSVTLDPTNRFAFVPDLGLDRLMVYRLDAARGMLEPHTEPWIKMIPGAGPRHVALHPDGGFAYLVNELDSTVAVLAYDGAAGKFELVQLVPTLPPEFDGESTCAEIQVAPSGRFVYASNRGHNSIVVFSIDPSTGKLSLVAIEPTRGGSPRNFGIDPSGSLLLAANQDSDTVVAFRIDPNTGALSPTGAETRVPTPVCIKFFSL